MGNVELFEQMAERYDNEERIRVAKIIAASIRRHVGEARNKSALDYGCGTGLVGLELADRFDSILFVDASQQMVQQVRRKIRAAGIETAEALCWDLTAGDAPERTADYVILAQVLLHIADVPSVLSSLYRLVNGGGHLLIVDFDKNENIASELVHNGFEQRELILLCKAAGFADARAETFYHGEKIFMNKDASLFLLDAVKRNSD